jgi:hypothetical protein
MGLCMAKMHLHSLHNEKLWDGMILAAPTRNRYGALGTCLNRFRVQFQPARALITFHIVSKPETRPAHGFTCVRVQSVAGCVSQPVKARCIDLSPDPLSRRPFRLCFPIRHREHDTAQEFPPAGDLVGFGRETAPALAALRRIP